MYVPPRAIRDLLGVEIIVLTISGLVIMLNRLRLHATYSKHKFLLLFVPFVVNVEIGMVTFCVSYFLSESIFVLILGLFSYLLCIHLSHQNDLIVLNIFSGF